MKNNEAQNFNRFKFRVWDCKEQKYGLGVYEKNRNSGITEIKPPASIDTGRFIIEQSTGKKDMNGTLIFEGDVLISYYDGQKHISIVKWYQGNMVLISINNGNHITLVWDGLKWAVIGNCHEIAMENMK